jgi:DNA-binding SARP family transcriptional activator
MLHLTTLGRLEMARGAPPRLEPIPLQLKRLGLLAYLCVASSREAQRRDTIVALFWPEVSQDEARRALRQALYYLRRQLGPGVLVTSGDETVNVDGGRLWCDVVAFERALEGGQLAAALELYGGGFLEGAFLPEVAPELEEWTGRTRSRLRDRAADAARRLAVTEEAAGRLDQALTVARQGYALAPDDEPGLRRLVGLLDRMGDHAGALRVYQDFARRMREEYGVEPATETRTVVAKIRASGQFPGVREQP